MKIKSQLEKVNNMDNNQRITYTKNCLEFLHYKCVTPDDKDFRIYQGKHNNLPEMIDANFNDGFLNNWNWIMEIVDKILAQGFRKYSCTHEEHSRCVFTDMAISYQKHEFGGGNIVADSGKCTTEKAAVVQAINQFLIWYSNE
jgi:hypothetical protein